MSEAEIMKQVMLAASKLGFRVLRNNVGVLQDKQGRYIRYGVCNPGGRREVDVCGSGVVGGSEVVE